MTSCETGSDDDWLGLWPNRLTAMVDLVCFPGAGAGASLFRPWHRKLPGYCSMQVCQLPGRENRIDEAPVEDLSGVADRIVEIYLSRRAAGRPVVVFGHSMGGVIAYEFARRLAGENPALVSAVLISASTPPRHDQTAAPPDEAELKSMLMAFDSDNHSIISNDELFASLAPTLTSDFQMLRRHKVDGSEELADIPTYLLSGIDDPVVPGSSAARWSDHLGEPVYNHEFPGGHQFPFRESQGAVLALVRDLLDRAKTNAVFQ